MRAYGRPQIEPSRYWYANAYLRAVKRTIGLVVCSFALVKTLPLGHRFVALTRELVETPFVIPKRSGYTHEYERTPVQIIADGTLGFPLAKDDLAPWQQEFARRSIELPTLSEQFIEYFTTRLLSELVIGPLLIAGFVTVFAHVLSRYRRRKR